MKADKQLSIKLKNKGFDVPTKAYWYHGDTGTNVDHYIDTHGCYNWNDDYLNTSVPTLNQVTDWLRSQGLHVSVDWDGKCWFYFIKELKEGGNSMVAGEYSDHDIALLHSVTAAVEMVQ